MKVFVILILLIEIMMTCQSRRIRDLGFLQHVQRTMEFRCARPQLRSIPVRELLLVEPSTDEQWNPPLTVLARCDDHTGCCREDEICSPKDIDNIRLVFSVHHLVDTNRPSHHEIILAKNHTRCHCVQRSIIQNLIEN